MQIQADFCCLHLQTHHLHEQELVQNEHFEWMLLKDQLTPKKAGFQVGWTSPDKLLHLPHTAGWGPQSNFSCSCSTLQRGPASSSAPSEQTHSRPSIQPLPSSSCCYITHTSLCHWLSSPGYKYHLTLLILITFHFPPSKIPYIFKSIYCQLPCPVVTYFPLSTLSLFLYFLQVRQAALPPLYQRGSSAMRAQGGSFQPQFLFHPQNRSEFHLQWQISSATSTFVKRDAILKKNWLQVPEHMNYTHTHWIKANITASSPRVYVWHTNQPANSI